MLKHVSMVFVVVVQNEILTSRSKMLIESQPVMGRFRHLRIQFQICMAHFEELPKVTEDNYTVSSHKKTLF